MERQDFLHVEMQTCYLRNCLTVAAEVLYRLTGLGLGFQLVCSSRARHYGYPG